MTSLSTLAKLAEERVPDFKRSTVGRFGMRSAIVTPDDSPAALLMAVVLWIARNHRPLGIWRYGGLWISTASAVDFEATPDSIARAALVALLRAHDVEVTS